VCGHGTVHMFALAGKQNNPDVSGVRGEGGLGGGGEGC
jgi:hypothetical protein